MQGLIELIELIEMIDLIELTGLIDSVPTAGQRKPNLNNSTLSLYFLVVHCMPNRYSQVATSTR